MGVFEEAPASPGMHWQQFDRWGSVHHQQERLLPELHGHSPTSPAPHHHLHTHLHPHLHHGGLDPEGSRCSGAAPQQHGHMGPGATAWFPPPGPFCPEAQVLPLGHHQQQQQPSDVGKVGFEYHASSSLSPPPQPPPTPPTPSSSQRAPSPPSSSCSSKVDVAAAASASSGPPASPRTQDNAGGTAAVGCAGCGEKIVDRFYLLAVDQRWHSHCLKCSQCAMMLESEGTCFARDGRIYCKDDYYRLFGLKRCARCQCAIASHELVMRAREYVFHVRCFTCVTCHGVLSKGDHFGMHDHLVFCSQHYEMSQQQNPPPSAAVPEPAPTPPPPTPAPLHPQPLAFCPAPQEHPKMHFYNGSGSGQKGRPRKRKAKDLEALTASLDLNSDGYLDGAGYPAGASGPLTPNGQPQRTKRMRTSFKHHQLRTMKSYFAINHNPDAKDLKQLSQKTGLPKRVLQVWFQNARAKWRRMMLKQEGKGPEKAQESGHLADMVPTSLAQQYGGGGGLQPATITTEEQSPQFFLDANEQT